MNGNENPEREQEGQLVSTLRCKSGATAAATLMLTVRRWYTLELAGNLHHKVFTAKVSKIPTNGKGGIYL